ncbi:hypothetical protein OG749_39925 [Streptomyces nojiriensis]|uniref:hypothetical protein n=1 Tax=Streptomyces nojiriensis TaxID=66374 RepID=UPI002E19501C
MPSESELHASSPVAESKATTAAVLPEGEVGVHAVLHRLPDLQHRRSGGQERGDRDQGHGSKAIRTWPRRRDIALCRLIDGSGLLVFGRAVAADHLGGQLYP